MVKHKYNRKLVAVMSADVEGYSRLMSHGEAQTVTTLKTHREIISRLVLDNSGRVIDSPGDNILAEFSSVVEAVTCSLEIQDELDTKNSSLPTDQQMIFRIGINLGYVIEDEDRIYGDGVNIAARMEALAAGGGICVSGSAYDQIQNKLKVGCEFIGEQAVKNIAKPIPVYRIWKDPGAISCTVAPEEHTNKRKMILVSASGVLAVLVAALFLFHEKIPCLSNPNPDAKQYTQRTSIAVLPFQNLSDDPSQEYFSDGITNDIITDLSKFSELAVPASNTVFQYKGQYPDLKKVGRKLKVKYVLEGSVQKSGEHIRVNVQLIDTVSGNHIWADRFNHKTEDIFKLQDEIISNTLRKLATIKWPTFFGCHILLASIYGNANEKEKAAAEKEKILSLSPFFKLDFYGQEYQNPDHREKIVSGLRNAGLT